MVPKSMQLMVKKLLKLGFKEEPPYDELSDLIVSQIKKELKFDQDFNPILHEYEWQHTIK
jgi:hypothetical protein